MQVDQEGYTLHDKEASPQGKPFIVSCQIPSSTCCSFLLSIQDPAHEDNQLSHNSEHSTINQVPSEMVESIGSHQEKAEEENFPELVHDENNYTIPETVVKRLRQQGEDPTQWNLLAQAKSPSREENALSMSAIEEDDKQQLDQPSHEDDDTNPYETVRFEMPTPTKSCDSSGKETDLMNVIPPTHPLQPSPILEIKEENTLPYQGSSYMDDDPNIPHTKPNQPEPSSTDKDGNSSTTKKLPIKFRVSEKTAIYVCMHAYVYQTMTTFCM